MDSGDNVSLNSTESEDYGDKEFTIRAIHAEKIDEDGTKKWLVAWDGYLSDDNLWLTEDAFTDKASLQEWEVKKRKIEKGLIDQYLWQEWDKRQSSLEQQRAIDKQRRQRIRAQKRRDARAVKKNGRWLDPVRRHHSHDWKRTRSSSNESYVDDEDVLRPLKRTITDISSDSDDDKPLISVHTSTMPDIRQPDTIQSSSEQGTGRADHRRILNLPIRTSQSPLPTERPKKAVATATSKPKVAEVEENLSRPQTQGKSILTTTNEETPAKSILPPLRTAIRSSKPKSQSIFNIPKRLLAKKNTSSSAARKATMPPVAKDFYNNPNAMWAINSRRRNEPAPNVDDLHLVSVPNAAHDRGRQFNRLAAENVESDPSNSKIGKDSRAFTSTLAATAHSNRPPAQDSDAVQSNGGTGILGEQDMEEMMDIDPPSGGDLDGKEPSLFVGDSQDPINEKANAQAEGQDALRKENRPMDLEASSSSTLNGKTMKSSSEGLSQVSNRGIDPPVQARVESDKSMVQQTPTNNFNLSVDIFSDRGKRLIQDVLDASTSPSEKQQRLQRIFALPSSFSSTTTREQQTVVLKHLLDWVLPVAQLPKALATSETDVTVPPIQDPRLLRRQSNAAELAHSNLRPSSANALKLSFQQLKEQYLQGEPYTPEAAISMFKKLFHIDWEKMAGGSILKVPVMIVYPVVSPLTEHKFLEDSFLSGAKARTFLLTDPDWKAFRELSAPVPQYIDATGRRPSEPFDARKHAKRYTGATSILLVHESLDDLNSFRHVGDLWSCLRNPNFRVFRISLGEPYQASNSTAVCPESGVQELAKEGQHILITDSVFVFHPQEALLIFEYLNLKLQNGSSVAWKIFARPGLIKWLLKLQDVYRKDPQKVAAYAEIHAYINKLVPYGQRRHTYSDNEWIPSATAALEIPTLIEGYRVNPGLASRKDGDSDLAHNDELLVGWFGRTTRKTIKHIRSHVVLLSDRVAYEKAKSMAGLWRHVRFMPAISFVGTKENEGGQVRSALLQAEWKKRASKQTNIRA